MYFMLLNWIEFCLAFWVAMLVESSCKLVVIHCYFRKILESLMLQVAYLAPKYCPVGP